MKLTIDTKHDDKEDILHAIALLERYVATERTYIEKQKAEEAKPSTEMAGMADFANMMNSDSTESSDESSEEEVPKIQAYD